MVEYSSVSSSVGIEVFGFCSVISASVIVCKRRGVREDDGRSVYIYSIGFWV